MTTFRFILFVCALAAAPVANTSSAASTSGTSDEEYRKSLESYRATAAAYERDRIAYERYRTVFLTVCVVVVGSLIAFVVIPSRRDQKAQFAVSLENQKALAEIKALLEKREK